MVEQVKQGKETFAARGEEVRCSRREGIGYLSFGDPKRANSMPAAFWAEFQAAVQQLDDDPSVRVIILSTEGKHFSSGIDIALLSSIIPAVDGEMARELDLQRRTLQRMQRAFTAIDACRVPVIAVVQGACIGAALDLVSACDILYATDNAHFCIHETNIGLPADLGSLQRLPRKIPAGLLNEIAYTGRRLSAAEAFRIGFVNAVFPDQVIATDHAHNIAAEIAKKAPTAIIGIKKILAYSENHSVADGLDYVATWNAGLVSNDDLKEGIAASQERRPPVFPDLKPQ